MKFNLPENVLSCEAVWKIKFYESNRNISPKQPSKINALKKMNKYTQNCSGNEN